MKVPINQRRGLNRQEAIEYLGVKPRFFDAVIREKIKSTKIGTSEVFDRLDLDNIFDEIKLFGGNVGPKAKGVTQWPEESQAFMKQIMENGELTKATKAQDFKAVLEHIMKQKTG